MEKNSKPNPNAKKGTKTSFEIPRQFFAQLNEFSNGGFCLITVNENGSPVVYSHFDNSVTELGLRKFALDYFRTIDTVQREATENSVYSANHPVCDEDEEDDEE